MPTDKIQTIRTQPFADQKPGTSGLRKTVITFARPHYAANFVQSIFDVLHQDSRYSVQGHDLILGGDGRYYSDQAIHIIVGIAVAHGVRKIILGAQGVLSTPAASYLVRKRNARLAMILTASHNPGGPNGDFGIKFNLAGGAPAPESVTEQVYDYSKAIQYYHIYPIEKLDYAKPCTYKIRDTEIEVIDPVEEYAELMRSQFDFEAIRELIGRPGFSLCFDAMHGVTGPYAIQILEQQLGAPEGSVIRGQMLPDFGGGHPDPGLDEAKWLAQKFWSPRPPSFGAASDGDGDRNMIVGPGMMVSPGDSLAIIAAHAHLIPAFSDGLKGVARSMPTSRAVDRVAQSLGLPHYETPTGWKFFCNLLDDGRIRLCGEESFGTGSDHIREKDGLWAVLCWLNILARVNKSLPDIVREHWDKFGRHYYSRLDYEGIDQARAGEFMAQLAYMLPKLPGRSVGGEEIVFANEFRYHDPVDGSVSSAQGVQIIFKDDARIVYRLSGTGTQGATLRVYLEYYVPPGGEDIDIHPQKAMAHVIERAEIIGQFEHTISRSQPSRVV